MGQFSLPGAPDSRTGRPGQKCLVLGHQADNGPELMVLPRSDNYAGGL